MKVRGNDNTEQWLLTLSQQVPIEVNRDASFKDVRALLGRWMDVNPDHVSFSQYMSTFKVTHFSAAARDIGSL